jgi:predicted amino acid dehydrogenase
MSLSKTQRREAFKKHVKQQMAHARKVKRKEKAKTEMVNTKAFWQSQSFGPASEVKRIDPATGQVIEVIGQLDK